MKIMLQLIGREFGLFWNNKVLATAFLVMSIVLAAILGFVYQEGKITKLPVIIIDKDHSPSSQRLIDMLSEHQVIRVQAMMHENTGATQVRLDKRAVAVIVISYRFEAGLLQNRKPEINCYLNMSNTLKANQARAAIQACISTMNASLMVNQLDNKHVPPPIASQQYESLHHNVFNLYNRGANYLLFLWPGLICSTLHQLLLIATAVGFSQEFADNNFQGLLKYGMSAPQWFLIKIVPYLLLSLVILGADYLLSICFRVPPPDHPAALLLTSILMVMGACSLGTLYSILFPNPLKATQVLMSFASPALTLSGFTWPGEGIPVALNLIADIIPLKPFLKAMTLIWLDGASINQVIPELMHQAILITVYSLLAILFLRKKIRNELKQLPGLLLT